MADPGYERFLRGLASFCRLVAVDKRGVGLSDRVEAYPTCEQQMDDLGVVMEAVGSERAALLGTYEGATMCLLFAATYPERVRSLVAAATTARFTASDDYPTGLAPETVAYFQHLIDTTWGTDLAEPLGLFAASRVGDAAFGRWYAQFLRLSMGPGNAANLLGVIAQLDVRDVLPAIRVPTLVLQHRDDPLMQVSEGRYLAEHIAGARYVEVPGPDSVLWAGDVDVVLGEIQEFLTGARSTAEADRVLSTVVFTDIVGSTERAAALGDRAWHALLDRHDAAVREVLTRSRGREVKTTGDGVLATFDGPARAIRAAVAIRDQLRSLGLEVRAGLHTGEIELRGDDVGGIAVNIGQRVSSLAGPGQVFVSRTVVDLVAGSGLEFVPAGRHELKGVPGDWDVFAVVDAGPPVP